MNCISKLNCIELYLRLIHCRQTTTAIGHCRFHCQKNTIFWCCFLAI